MDDEFAKVNSMLDDDAPEEETGSSNKSASKKSWTQKLKNKANSTASKAATGAVNVGTRAVAGGLAAVQSLSATSFATILSIILGLGTAGAGEDFNTAYRDDYDPTNPYECLDEYSEAYKGVFGTINTSPLAEQNEIVVKRLKEINEWSKAYVGQSIPDRLVCTDSNCPYYGHEGCTDPDHGVEKVDDGTYSYYDSDAKIDLANVKRIHSFFSAYGLTDVQIAAICGVMTMESRVDFTSIEGYNIQGDRYNLDPSVATDEYAFKPWAEGIGGSPIQTPTCIHEISSNTYSGPDEPIDYAAYSSEYPSIYKLGIGTVGFTDGPGFYNNTFLRNYADKLNDRVTLIQKLVEGSRGWREELRQRAADLFHVAYGAEGDDKRGTATAYEEKLELDTLLLMTEAELSDLIEAKHGDNWGDRYVDGELKSSGWLYKDAYEKYKAAEEALDQAVKTYEQKVQEYMDLLGQLQGSTWNYHSVSVGTSGDSDGAPLQDITFEKHKPEDLDKLTTSFSSEGSSNPNISASYVDIFEPENLKECEKSEEEEDFIEYRTNESLPGGGVRDMGDEANNIDVVYRQAHPIWVQTSKPPHKTVSPSGASGSITVTQTAFPSGGEGLPEDINLGAGISPTMPDPNDYIIDTLTGPMFNTAAYRAALDAYYTQLAAQAAYQAQWEADNDAILSGQLPTPPTQPTPPVREDFRIGYDEYGNPIYDNEAYLAAYQAYQKAMEAYNMMMNQYLADLDYFNNVMGGQFPASAAAIAAERAQIDALIAQLQQKAQEVQDAFDDMMEKKEEFFETLDDFNKWSKNHAHDVLRFYNALQDYYNATRFDMESKIRDATYSNTTIFGDIGFYTEAAYEYEFNLSINDEKIKFRDVFDEFRSGDPSDPPPADNEDPKPTVQELKLYYELWQNYAKYATNLPQNGKYINWWTPEVQLLFFVGGSYNAEEDKGIAVREEYRNVSCGQCQGLNVPERDTVGKYYYDWMSTWKGENYTARDITTATKNFFYDMVSGGFDDGTLEIRTEYAYAYYYMFQYDSPYQQAINYASAGGEASKIMDEMIAEGRWQTNTSNTLSDTAMPHNDKWKTYQPTEITRQWEIDTSTAMSTSMLATLGSKQSHSRVNLLTDVWNACKYINVIDNETIGNSAMYLVDNPLIYGDKNNEFYIMKYGKNPDPEPEAISPLAHVVFDVINKRLAENGKTAMTGEMSDGFNFVKTCVLWSGMDVEFENINNVDDLKEYLEEATSSVWQDEEDYQTDPDSEKAIGRGNSKIWEQRKLGPYYDTSGNVYYRYQWVLVPRVLSDGNSSSTDLKWYDDMRNDPDAERSFGDVDEDLDKWDVHNVDEHDTNNTPSIAKGEDVDGYKRKLNENERNADWIRVDWECWDKSCEECGGVGGHGDTKLLCPGDIIIKDDKIYLWLGEDAVQNMFPLEKNSTEKLVIAGGDEATKLKTMDESGFEWSKPCNDYVNHDTPCPTHGNLRNLPKTPEKHDDDSCNPYNPDGKWTVYRLVTPNYTDAYRSAGVIFNPNDDIDYEAWFKYKYKGMGYSADSKTYLERIRMELGEQINTEYPRDLT